MVISNKQRKLQNRRKAAKKAKRMAAASAPKAPKPATVPAPANKLLPVGVKSDDSVLISDMDLPSRAIIALEEDGLMTKGDIRKYIRESGDIGEVRGIGDAWASLIEKLVK